MGKTSKLEATQPNDREVRVTRAFNAPPAVVFDAFTKPQLVRPSRLVHTENYDPGDIGGTMGGEALVTSEFKPQGGGTLYTVTIHYQSKADRDAAVKTGMTDGMEMSYVRLDSMLATAAA
jgi:uncharacterized protein YndB with AHSA1/START domain